MTSKSVYGLALAMLLAALGCNRPSRDDQPVVAPHATASAKPNGLQTSVRNIDDVVVSPLPASVDLAGGPSKLPIASSRRTEPAPVTSIRLSDVTSQTGIQFWHTDGGSGEGYIVEGVASGIVVFDYDQDGFEDIYFLNGAPTTGASSEDSPRNVLYRNNGDWTFTDVTESAGVGDIGFALGATVADFDNDGDLDLYVANFGPNVLYLNNGDGTFTDVTHTANVSGGDKLSAGCSFLDIDGDGHLDLYVANYVDFTYDKHVPIVMKGHRFHAGPQYYEPVPDTLYRNLGDGTFIDVTESSGIGSHAGPGMATICWDFNGNGYQDIFVCNDGSPNFLFLNDGTGWFKESALLAGLAYDFNGKANSSMGVDIADYDGDGKLDLFVTDYQGEMPVLYRNLGNGLYEDVTSSAKIAGDLFAHVHWGTGFVDFDNDGSQDLFIACGHFDPVELIDDRTSKKVRNYLLMNRGDGTFVDVSLQAGDGMAVVESSRGAAFADFDNDGKIDVVILNSNSQPTILRNDSHTDHHWLQVQLRRRETNRFAIGAQVRVSTQGKSQLGISVSGRGYQGHFGNRIHFGLGDHTTVDFVEVRWPDGKLELFHVDAVDQVIELVQGSGDAVP
jgi:enediyne biosynthesis protein E4